MAQFLLLCLIFVEAFLGLAMASENTAPSYSNPPASIPAKSYQAEPPVTRKLGGHRPGMVVNAPSPSPSKEAKDGGAVPLDESSSVVNLVVQSGDVHLERKHHHSIDKSVAGGGVILGGLATTFLVAVFCYIRATGRRKAAEITTS